MEQERAETGRLQELLTQVGAGLDELLKFEHPDALVNRESWQAALDIPLPQKGSGIDCVTAELLEHVIPNGSAITRPGFSGYIVTGASTASALASAASSIACPARYSITAFNLLEELSLDWMAQMFGLDGMKGIYSSGGSVANLLALGAARQSAFENVGHDPARDGVNRAVGIYASHECHRTIQRAGGVLGIGRSAVRSIDCDIAGRIQIDALQSAIETDLRNNVLPMAIVANAGTTNTGAIDPLQAIAEIAAKYGVWLHVDGAYGLPGILDERVRHLYQGLEQADSIIVDPHKWLGAAVGIAATFVHDRGLLERAFTQGYSDYLEGTLTIMDREEEQVEHSLDDFGIPYYNYGLELSSPPRGVAVWAMIREIGVDGLRARIQRHNDMAREIAGFCKQHPNLELLLEPTLSTCCFRYVATEVTDLDMLNQRLRQRLVRENEFMPSTTRVDGKLVLRPCFIGVRSDRSQVDGLLQAVLRIGDALVAESSMSSSGAGHS